MSRKGSQVVEGRSNGLRSHYGNDDHDESSCASEVCHANSKDCTKTTYAHSTRSSFHTSNNDLTTSHSMKCSSSFYGAVHKKHLQNYTFNSSTTPVKQQCIQKGYKTPPITVASIFSHKAKPPLVRQRKLDCNNWNDFLPIESSIADNKNQIGDMLVPALSHGNNVSSVKTLCNVDNEIIHHELYSGKNVDVLSDIKICKEADIGTLENTDHLTETISNPLMHNTTNLHTTTTTTQNTSAILPVQYSSGYSSTMQRKSSIVAENEYQNNVVVPPPMLFIPIFMPPLVQTSLTTPAVNLTTMLPLRIKSSTKAENEYMSRKLSLKVRLTKPSRGPKRSRTLKEKIIQRKGSTYVPRNYAKVDLYRLQKHRRNCFCNWIELVIKYSTATLGRKLDTFGNKRKYKYFPSATIHRLVHGFDPIERKIEYDDGAGERHIIPSSMEHIRQTYAMQCKIKKPPDEQEQPLGDTKVYDADHIGEANDFLYVIMGLTNIFIMQFIMVIIIFFVRS